MKRPFVLIADDHDNIRSSMVEFLERVFDIVGAAGSGEELIEAAIRLRPDVIVSDLLMPGINGLAARDKLIDLGQRIPFVFVSGLVKEIAVVLQDECIVRNESPVAFVYKGDMSFHLINAVEAVLSGRLYLSPYYRE